MTLSIINHFCAMRHTIRLFRRHELTKRAPFAALLRFIRWQLTSRLTGAEHVVPFAGNTKLIAARGWTGATGNIYVGLHEFNDMAFVVHALRQGDLFADVGANLGSYSILAAGVAGASAIAFEPVPSTAAKFDRIVALNSLGSLIEVKRLAVGESPGEVRFSSEYDSANRVILEGEQSSDREIVVPSARLDDVFEARTPKVMKIDVEGFEERALRGAPRLLNDQKLHAILIELNGQSTKYGSGDERVRVMLRDAGFRQCHYQARTRVLTEGPPQQRETDNELYIRNPVEFSIRLKSAPVFMVLGQSI